MQYLSTAYTVCSWSLWGLKWFVPPIVWIKLAFMERDKVKKYTYNKGFYISQKYQKYYIWDKFVEPVIIRQWSIIFTAGNSFIKGMISDNADQENMENLYEIELQEIKSEIEEELE